GGGFGIVHDCAADAAPLVSQESSWRAHSSRTTRDDASPTHYLWIIRRSPPPDHTPTTNDDVLAQRLTRSRAAVCHSNDTGHFKTRLAQPSTAFRRCSRPEPRPIYGERRACAQRCRLVMRQATSRRRATPRHICSKPMCSHGGGSNETCASKISASR